MSEYQYYEFQAVDRPLTRADQEALRSLSTRARITATSFTNSYEWGSFKGDPAKLMETWFDLHLYLANWGSRSLMIRWPARLLDRHMLGGFLDDVEGVQLRTAGRHLILEIAFDDVESEEWDDGAGWLAALAPLRADVLGGDLRLFYLLWLKAVEAQAYRPDQAEPLPGIGPMTGALEALVGFLGIDRDLAAAAAERPADPLTGGRASSKQVKAVIVAMTEREKTELLERLFEGDAHVAAELRATVRDRLTASSQTPRIAARSVGQLCARADAIRSARERAQAEKAAADRKRQEQEAERSRRVRLDALARRGESVWREIETEIERRNASGYEKAAGLLLDLKAVAKEKSTTEDFARRLRSIRDRHARKGQFMQRIALLG